MKKLLAYLLAYSLIFAPFPAVAFNQLDDNQQVVYRGTITGLTISAVDGTAFIDGANASVTALADGTHEIQIYDASGRMIKGVLKAVGSGITKGAAKDVDGITKANPGILTLAAAHGYSNLMLVYFSGLTEMTSLNTKYKTLTGNSGDTFQLGDLSAETAAETTGGNCAEQVTAPSTSGSTIVSAKAGTVYNFSYKNASFTYNAASYYVVVKKIRGEVIMDTKTIDTGSALIDSTTANAFAAPLVSAAAYDFAAYRDGKHRLDIYSSAGVLWSQGYISATAPSGEDAPDEKLTGPFTNSSSNPYEPTFSSVANDITAANTTGAGRAASNLMANTAGELYKYTGNLTLTSGQAPSVVIGLSQSSFSPGTGAITLVAGANTTFITCGNSTYDYFGYVNTSATSFAVPDGSFKRVVMPAATGVLLLSAPGGARGYAFKHASFDPNATGLVMKVVKVID